MAHFARARARPAPCRVRDQVANNDGGQSRRLLKLFASVNSTIPRELSSVRDLRRLGQHAECILNDSNKWRSQEICGFFCLSITISIFHGDKARLQNFMIEVDVKSAKHQLQRVQDAKRKLLRIRAAAFFIDAARLRLQVASCCSSLQLGCFGCHPQHRQYSECKQNVWCVARWLK